MWPATVLPTGWLFCHGQTLDISAYTPLYNIIGTRYGGDGVTKFMLPDYRNRMICGSPTTEQVGTIAELRSTSGDLIKRVDYNAVASSLGMRCRVDIAVVVYGDYVKRRVSTRRVVVRVWQSRK